MRVGIDTFSLRDLKLDPFAQLDWIHEHDFEGAQFGALGVDVGRLREIRTRADELGLYSHPSVASPNWLLGPEGFDERLATLREQVTAAAAVGWRELHSSLGSEKNRYHHETRSWPDQRAGSTRR